MQDLNYQHLRYFWVVAREGNLTRASARMLLSPSTVSAQIKTLEASLDCKLFQRRGRNLVLTERGELVKSYADEIFGLGQEMTEALRVYGGALHVHRLRVGVSNNLPKLVAYRLLSPAMHLDGFMVHLICEEDDTDRLVAELDLHHLDLVISDTPVGLTGDARAKSLLLGECGVMLYGTPALVARYRGEPELLNDAPVLLPDAGSAMRQLVEGWFAANQIRPRVVAEFGDSALMKAFGQEGAGLFPAPSMVREDLERRYGVEALSELPGVRECFYALVAPEKLLNPAIQAILNTADAALEH